MNYPLAVRSSSLLEDSPYQPFAGVYETVMLPNDEPDRVRRLLDAVKAVYLSMFRQSSKLYLNASPYRLEEEKMAVVIQKLTGVHHANRFYPDIAGVARSHNFYPIAPIAADSDPMPVDLVGAPSSSTSLPGGPPVCPSTAFPPVEYFKKYEDVVYKGETWSKEMWHAWGKN